MKKPTKPRSKPRRRTNAETITIIVFILAIIAIFAYNIYKAPICTDVFCILGKLFYWIIGGLFVAYSYWAIKTVK
jgi:uncharacterized MnhB-related membrane protein